MNILFFGSSRTAGFVVMGFPPPSLGRKRPRTSQPQIPALNSTPEPLRLKNPNKTMKYSRLRSSMAQAASKAFSLLEKRHTMKGRPANGFGSRDLDCSSPVKLDSPKPPPSSAISPFAVTEPIERDRCGFHEVAYCQAAKRQTYLTRDQIRRIAAGNPGSKSFFWKEDGTEQSDENDVSVDYSDSDEWTDASTDEEEE